MLSRVAENLYWLGRYIERAENAARMAHVEYLAAIERGELCFDGPGPTCGHHHPAPATQSRQP